MSRILVADDNSNIQKMVALALKDQGIEVIAVGNGEAAIRKFTELKPDLVLADIFMPVRNGYEVCEFVKRDPRHANVPVVLLVGVFDPFDEREAQRVGADGVLKKPFVPPDPLIGMVTGLLAGLAAHKPASEREVLVETPVPALATMAAQGSAPFVVEPPVEDASVREEFARPGRVEFGVGEQPLAFGELLGSVGAAMKTEPEIVTNTDASLAESRMWDQPAEAEETVDEESEEPAWRRGESLLPKGDEVRLPQVTSAEETQELDSVAPAEAKPGNVGWIPIVPPAGRESGAGEASVLESPGTAEAELEPMPSYPGFLAEANPFGAESVAEEPATNAVDSLVPIESTPETHAASELLSGHLKEMAEQVFRDASRVWPGPVAPVAETPAQIVPPVLPAMERETSPTAAVKEAVPVVGTGSAVQTFSAPPMPSPQAIEEVVERVIERMQPQIMEVVRKEILRPVVEALVRRELEKKS